jgi:hypothetical protein
MDVYFDLICPKSSYRPEASVKEQAERVEGLSKGCHGSDFVYTRDAGEKEELWKVRKEAFWSTFTLRPGAEAMVTVRSSTAGLAHLELVFSGLFLHSEFKRRPN